METTQIKKLIESGIPGARAEVSGGDGKYETTVVSEHFRGLPAVKRHQAVYATVAEYISGGMLHALTIRAYTPDEAPDGPPDEAVTKT